MHCAQVSAPYLSGHIGMRRKAVENDEEWRKKERRKMEWPSACCADASQMRLLRPGSHRSRNETLTTR